MTNNEFGDCNNTVIVKWRTSETSERLDVCHLSLSYVFHACVSIILICGAVCVCVCVCVSTPLKAYYAHIECNLYKVKLATSCDLK